jgi:hypothetical protein
VIPMRKVLSFLLTFFLAGATHAQSNAPVRLAIIAATSETAAAADLLTAELSRNPRILLLERNEIEKIYKEQGRSAQNQGLSQARPTSWC